MTQTIPIIFCELNNLKLHAGPVRYSNGILSVKDTVPAVTLDCTKAGKERGKILVADVESLNRRRFNPGFMEYCKVPGNDLWLIESIYDDVDVLDAFLGNADKIVFPYEDIKNDSVLPDILGISDNCIPLLKCINCRCRNEDPLTIVKRLSDAGFHNIMVADLDGSVYNEKWESLLDECGGLITYSPLKKPDTEMHIVAQDVFPFTR